MTPVPLTQQVKTVNMFLTRGRAGLRHSCATPLRLRLEYAVQNNPDIDPQVLKLWTLMPYRSFWGYLRCMAEQEGLCIAEAFLIALETEVDLTREPPHPLLSPR